MKVKSGPFPTELDQLSKTLAIGNKENRLCSGNRYHTDESCITESPKIPFVFRGNEQLSMVLEEEDSKANICENIEPTHSRIRLPNSNDCGKKYKSCAQNPVKLGVIPPSLSLQDESIIRSALNEPVKLEEMLTRQQKLVDAIRQTDSFVQCTDILRRSMMGSKVALQRNEWMSQDTEIQCSARIMQSLELGGMVSTRKDMFTPSNDSPAGEKDTACSAHLVKQMNCKFIGQRHGSANYTETGEESKRKSKCILF